jgi:hypothetical protein
MNNALDYNRATKYLNAGNYAKALQFYKRAPDFKEKFVNMGTCYRGLLNDGLAVANYTIAAREDVPFYDGSLGPYSLALNNLGLMAYAYDSDAEAIRLYSSALALDGSYKEAKWNYGNALLRTCISRGDYTSESWKLGWSLYEYRFDRGAGSVGMESYLPRWDGVSSGSCIVVMTEQGLGDKIMFGRYVGFLRALFDRVIVVCDPSLDCFFSDYEIARSSAGLPGVYVPLCSLASVFGIVNEYWLAGKFTAKELNRERKNIGVVWSGSTTHRNNHYRSCSSRYFASLRDLGDLHSLNPGDAAVAGIKRCTAKSWSETAALVLALDVVVTVDTSIVHLCGSLGVPCIMIQPLHETDFRWGVGLSSTVWYKSVRIVQNSSWESAFAEVRELIEDGYVQRS